MRLEIDIPEHHYNNIMALDFMCLGRAPYKGIIMYAINAIKQGKVLEQEPTTKNNLGVDLISRADVLKLMQDNWHTHNGDWAMQESMDDIRELPSVTPQEPKWIPVSERLPEDRREVLVTAYWHETYQVMMASYFGDGLWWCVPFNNCGEHMQRLKPKAWMPLPSAYKRGEQE